MLGSILGGKVFMQYLRVLVHYIKLYVPIT